MTTAQTIIQIMAEQPGLAGVIITRGSSLKALGLDWTKRRWLAVAIEKRFGCACLFGDELDRCRTVGDLINAVNKNLRKQRRGAA